MKWRKRLNPERWQQLKQLVEEALDKNPSVRGAYLDEACGRDDSLRQEVQLLLDSYRQDDFLEKPAYEAVPELFQSETEDTLVGKWLGAYEVTGKIGHGGMGIVYLARDHRLDRPVAIKMLAPKYTRNPQFRERLKREARAAARLSHPGIATVYALEQFEEALYMVSEYVRGDTLLKLIEAGPVSMPQLIDIAIQLSGALAAAHEQGIIHRDLKPENVVRTESGTIKILDFGLARFEPGVDLNGGARITRVGMFLGTPAYASPEQLLGAEVDRRTDIFSFGVILYELATGQHPFCVTDSMSTVARILEAEVPNLTQINPSIPKALDNLIRCCLMKKPEDRYTNARELQNQLAELSSGRKAVTAVRPSSTIWWWQFHQVFAGFGYYALLYPLWVVKRSFPGIEGSLYFFPGIVAVGVAANLRLHLWFTSRFYPSELPPQRQKVSRWIRWGDWLFAIVLAISAIRIHAVHAVYATILMGAAIGSLVGFTLIEPTTTKAAWEISGSDRGKP
jgi:tRNA A-37 threonylcarbamoyl transferase component Bud32